MAEKYANPDMLVSTEWVAEHLNDPKVRIVESNEDPLLYDVGHIPNAVKVDWHTDLQDPLKRDFVDKEGFAELMRKSGIGNDMTVVFYGDKNNWFATYALWIFRMYGHKDTRIMNGGRQKWLEEGRPLTKDVPQYARAEYKAQDADKSIRAFRDEILKAVDAGKTALVDVRSPEEFRGEIIHMAGYPQEGAQRAGHVQGARSIPWARAANADGTFKSPEELRALYEQEGVTSDRDVIAYCRIGERSSHTWFVLTQLLGYKNVKNYDGSWTEYGSLVNVPVEKGAAAPIGSR